jgi:hypothetical protein
MTTEISAAKDRPAVSGRTVEITDEDETIVITFIPVPTNNKEGPR